MSFTLPDSVRREVLIAKLSSYGMGDRSISLINSYMSDREQSVQTALEAAPFLPVKCGLPQGSIFGPIAFLLVINDLPNVCCGEVSVFADDTSVVYVCDTQAELERKMQTDLLAIRKWCEDHLMMLNAKKTQYITFSKMRHDSPTLNIVLEGETIQKVDKTKFLGCVLDEKLDAGLHTEEIAKRLNKAIFIVKRLCAAAGRRVAKPVVEAYIQSHLNYCAGYWGMAPKTKLNRLYRLQKRAARAALGVRRSTEALETLRVLPLPLSLTYTICTFLHQQLTNRVPKVLEIELLGNNRKTRARDSRIIRLETRKSRAGRNSYYVREASVWNCLPADIRTTNSPSLFKTRLKNHLFKCKNERLNFF